MLTHLYDVRPLDEALFKSPQANLPYMQSLLPSQATCATDVREERTQIVICSFRSLSFFIVALVGISELSRTPLSPTRFGEYTAQLPAWLYNMACCQRA